MMAELKPSNKYSESATVLADMDKHLEWFNLLVAAGQSYREVGLRLGISKNTVLDIVKRHRADQAEP